MLFTGSALAADDYLDAVKKAAEQGHADAQYNLGAIYSRGEGVPEDDDEAVRWYRKAAEQGDAAAQTKLGTMYIIGKGVPEDTAEAVHWYRKAAEQGDAGIQAYVWFSIAAARGVENAKNANEMLTGEMTRAEITEAQKLSRKYWDSLYTDEDDVLNARWYRKVAEQGHAWAQARLGDMYDNGEGVPEDDIQAYA